MARLYIYYDPMADRDIADFLHSLPEGQRSPFLKRIIREHLYKKDMLTLLREAIRAETGGATFTANQSAPATSQEDVEMKDGLDALTRSWEN
jgi:hypothetical protein